ncbi:hypothetical protein D910_09819 [Dendroctonus ponderosae]|uniref:Uncharacterized protein n=1 Tax=Dendroctonus ponderosae TaxID=77166 RepID=U4UQS2_DENPD|nr:hypothetical protein D910_09819 [Dendroctonus ponderosae]
MTFSAADKGKIYALALLIMEIDAKLRQICPLRSAQWLHSPEPFRRDLMPNGAPSSLASPLFISAIELLSWVPRQLTD